MPASRSASISAHSRAKCSDRWTAARPGRRLLRTCRQLRRYVRPEGRYTTSGHSTGGRTMKLLGFPPSPNVWKVLATAHHMGVPLELQMVDLTKGEQRKPEY